MQGPTIIISREELKLSDFCGGRRQLRKHRRQSSFFWQTDWGQRTLHAKTLIIRHGRALDAALQKPGAGNSFLEIIVSRIVDWHSHHRVIRVITDAAFADFLSAVFRDHSRISNDLQTITGPGLRLVIGIARRSSPLVLVRNEHPVAPSNAIDLSLQSPFFAFEG